MITNDIQSIFCHPAICERLAGMLNYFLQHLVRDNYCLLFDNNLIDI
jgi:hypothetical protein